MSNDSGIEKPTSAGLWTREGKFYRVWHDGYHDRIQHIDAHNGFSGDHNYLANAPTGNWRKLTAEQSDADEMAELKHDIDELVATNKYLRSRLSVQGPIIKRGEHGVWMMANPPDSASRNLACIAMEALSMDSANDFRTRDKIIVAISPQLEKMLDSLAATPSPPEVIEGQGQVVAEEQVGHWLVIIDGGCTPSARFLGLRDVFNKGYRYMRCPTFPPRATFQAPPKPELVLFRVDGREGVFWGTIDSDGDYCESNSDKWWRGSACERLDPATGKPIQGE